MDEHFAKALGKQTWQQLQTDSSAPGGGGDERDDSSVDEHFTKALGDTWLRLKASRAPVTPQQRPMTSPTTQHTPNVAAGVRL